METNQRPTVISLFAGAGGIDYAFQQAGCNIVWANENDHDACTTYKLNFPEVVLVERDIRKIASAEIPDSEIIVGGFPCQPFSAVGAQKGFADARGNLFYEILRIIDAKKPSVIFLENVANLEKHDNGNTFRVIRNEITSRGYSFRYIVADAQNYGVPQRRNRIYMICFRDGWIANNFSFPERVPLTKHISDIIDRNSVVPESFYLKPGTQQYISMDQAIINTDQIYRFTDDCFGAKNRIIASRNGVAFTLLAGMGNWHDREPIIRDYKGIRKLTPYECFMLQGYPKEFSLKGIPLRSAYRQAGNTVCVPVVKMFAEKIVEALQTDNGDKKVNTLIGTLSSTRQLAVSVKNRFYHFPARFMPENMDSYEYLAIYQSKKLFPDNPGIHYIGEIQSYVVVPRSQILELPKQSEEPYCKVQISKWIAVNISNVRPPSHGVAVSEHLL